MHVPVPSLNPGARSQPAEIRRGHGGGIGRILWGQRHNELGMGGLGQTICDAFDENGNCIGYQDLSTLPNYDTTYTGPGEPLYPLTTPYTPPTVGVNPANVLNPIQAIGALNQTLAIAQGGSSVTTPQGGVNLYGSPATAAVAAASNPFGTLSAGTSSLMMPLLMLGGLFLVMNMSKR